VRASRVRQLFRLFGEAYEIGELAAAQRHLMAGFINLLGCVGLIRLRCHDYRPGGGADISDVTQIGFDDAFRARIPEQYSVTAQINPAVTRMIDHHAELQRDELSVVRRRDVLADAAWYHSGWVSELIRPARLDDVIYAGRRIGPAVCDGLGADRALGDSPFSDEDRELFRLFFGEVLCRFAAPSDGVMRLSPRERQMLNALLRGARRKEIAADLGLSLHTVNEYVRSLYKRLGVSGLPELYARFGAPPRGLPR
jgi:DNA-binding CsgD family transcriptional regulator